MAAQLLSTIPLQFYTPKSLAPQKLRIVKTDYLLNSVVIIQILSSCEKYCFTKSASPCRSHHLELQLKRARKWTWPSKILTNGTEFSIHFGWNGKRGIHLSISIFSGNVPVEWPEPFELPTENSGFCCQMVNGPGVLTIYMENPEIPVGKSNGAHHSIWSTSEIMGFLST